MARALGIHLRPDGYSFALCEGNAKKFGLKASGSGGLDGTAGDPIRGLGRTLAKAIKSAGVGKTDQVVLVLPSNDAVLRELSLPFHDREKVQQVLKFEVESDLYHLDIDDVVCDYVELHDDRSTATLMVAALPKTEIGEALDIADEAGYEPATVELDLGALVTAISTVPRDHRDEEENALEAFLHVGPYSSLLIVRSAEGIRAVRAIHIGWRELGRGLEDPAESAPSEEEELVQAEIVDAEAEDADEDDADEDEETGDLRLFGADPTLPVHLSFESISEQASPDARAALLRRIVGEVRRGLAALSSMSIARLHLMGAPVPGLAEQLTQRLGVPATPLQLDLFDGDGLAPDPVAAGAALRGLGIDGSAMNFRKEEYRFAGGLERVEGPLTFLLIGIIAFLLVDSVVLIQKTRARSRDTDAIYEQARKVIEVRLNEELDENAPKDWRIKTDFAGTGIDDLNRVTVLRGRLGNAQRDFEELVGEGDVEMPQSCLEAWRLAHDVVEEELEERFPGRWIVEGLEFTSSLRPSSRTEANVEVKLTVTLFGTDQLALANKQDALLRAFNRRPWIIENAECPQGFQASEVPDAVTGTINLSLSTKKAREANL